MTFLVSAEIINYKLYVETYNNVEYDRIYLHTVI